MCIEFGFKMISRASNGIKKKKKSIYVYENAAVSQLFEKNNKKHILKSRINILGRS